MENKKYDLATLPPTALRILIEFYRMSKRDGEQIKMPMEDIASRLNMAKSTVRQHIKILESSEFISSKQNFDALGRHMPKTYFMKLTFGEFIQTMFKLQGKKPDNQQQKNPQPNHQKNNRPNNQQNHHRNRQQNNHQQQKSKETQKV